MNTYAGLAGLYDAFTTDVPYEKFADLYEAIFRARGKNPRVLLDLACGTGSLVWEMSKRGYELIAVDSSPEMLSEVRDKFDGENGMTPPVLVCQMMQELDLYGTVDAVYSTLDSIDYLDEDEVRKLFRRLALFIEPEGLLIFDVFTPERFRSLDGQIFVDETDDALCLWRAEFDEETNCLIYGMDIFTAAGKLWWREQEEHIEHAHSEAFLKAALEDAGFYDIEIIRDGPHGDKGRIFFVSQNSGKGMVKNG